MTETTMTPQRIDPADCGCTDCLTGYSAPLSAVFDSDFIRALISGRLADATSTPLTVTRSRTFRDGKLGGETTVTVTFPSHWHPESMRSRKWEWKEWAGE